MTDQLTKKQTGATISVFIVICAVYFVIPDMGYIAPSLAAIAEVYGVDAGVASYLSTGVSLAQIVGALVCGIIVGKYIKHKTMLMIACGGMGILGMLPAVLPAGTPFEALMVDRIVFGFFLGFLQPIIFAFIAQVFVDENKRANGYGVGNVAFNVGAVFATSVGGICVGIAWNAAFWLYAVGLVVLVLVAIFYKEPEYVQKEELEAKEEKAEGKKVKITGMAWFFMAVFVVAMMLDYPFMTAFVPSAIEHGVCDGVIGGQMMSLFTGVGIIASALFGVMFKKMKLNVLPIMCAVAAVGNFVLFCGLGVAESLAVCILAVVIIGFGHSTITVAVPQCVSVACSPLVASAALAYTAIAMNLGVFASSPYMQIVASVAGTTDFSVVYATSAVLMLIWAVVVFAVIRSISKKNKEVSE